MINLGNRECEKIFSLGKNQYDIPVHKGARYSDSTISQKVKALKNEDIQPFLNYQHEKGHYPFSFLQILFRRCNNPNWLADKEKRDVIVKWVIEKLPIEKADASVCFELFLKAQNDSVDFKPFEEHIEHSKESEKMEMLDFALKLSNESINLHREFCSLTDCKCETQYKRKTNYINHFLKEFRGNTISNITKITWNGSQKELGELFVELKKNGWIDTFNYATIKACFTNSNTIQQIMKPNTDTSTGEDNYDAIYTPHYSPKFHGIVKNIKK